MKEWMKKNGSKILTVLASLSSVTAVGLAIKATPEANERIVDEENRRIREWCRTHAVDEVPDDISYGDYVVQQTKMTFFDKAKACWPAYVPTGTALAIAMACGFGAQWMNEREISGLVASCAFIDKVYDSYRARAKKVAGEQLDFEVMRTNQKEMEDAVNGKPAWDENQTFYLDLHPACITNARFFETTMEMVQQAEYVLNRMFVLRGWVSVNDFLTLLHQPIIDGGDVYGWDVNTGEVWYGYQWIDFTHTHKKLDDGMLVCSIGLPFAPHPLFEADRMEELQEHST